jgi:hypothetical protein
VQDFEIKSAGYQSCNLFFTLFKKALINPIIAKNYEKTTLSCVFTPHRNYGDGADHS